jgi:hypothetical protein
MDNRDNDLKYSMYCYHSVVVNNRAGVPVMKVVPCKYYQGIVGLQDGMCLKLKVPIYDYCKQCKVEEVKNESNS